MIRRLLFVVFFAFGGFFYYVPKWVLLGTKGSRDRKKLIKLQKAQLKQLEQLNKEGT